MDELKHVESILLILLDRIRMLSGSDCALAQEFIDHGEYALALEFLFDIVVQKSLVMDVASREQLRELATKMKLRYIIDKLA